MDKMQGIIKHLKVKYLLPSTDKAIRDSNGNCVGFITATFTEN